MNDQVGSEEGPLRRMWLAVIGLLLAVVSPVFWVMTLGNHVMLVTGLAMWIAMAAGLAIAIFAARRDVRKRTRGIAMLTACWVAFSVIGFFVFTRLPQPDGLDDVQRVAAFTLPDHLGHPTSLGELAGDGSAMLVFYRGHW